MWSTCGRSVAAAAHAVAVLQVLFPPVAKMHALGYDVVAERGCVPKESSFDEGESLWWIIPVVAKGLFDLGAQGEVGFAEGKPFIHYGDDAILGDGHLVHLLPPAVGNCYFCVPPNPLQVVEEEGFSKAPCFGENDEVHCDGLEVEVGAVRGGARVGCKASEGEHAVHC